MSHLPSASHHLVNLSYPATKQALVKAAQTQGASLEVIAALQELPDRSYSNPREVIDELFR